MTQKALKMLNSGTSKLDHISVKKASSDHTCLSYKVKNSESKTIFVKVAPLLIAESTFVTTKASIAIGS